MAKKRKIKDLTINEIVKACKKRNDCVTCPLIELCGLVFGGWHFRDINEEIDL